MAMPPEPPRPPDAPLTRREALGRAGALLAAGAFVGPRTRALSAAIVDHHTRPGQRPDPITRPIPSSGERLPVIGMGTWQTFDVGRTETERAPLREVLRIFVEEGGTVVDASPMYGASEEVLGDLAAELDVQDRLWWATKVWTDEGARAGVEQMEGSMELLHRPRVELMQVHNLVDAATHLETLVAWKEEGRIDYVGITRSQTRAFPEVERWMDDERLDFVQINYSMAEPEAEERILRKARERGLAVLLNRPLGGAICSAGSAVGICRDGPPTSTAPPGASSSSSGPSRTPPSPAPSPPPRTRTTCARTWAPAWAVCPTSPCAGG